MKKKPLLNTETLARKKGYKAFSVAYNLDNAVKLIYKLIKIQF
jgi:hypothetical protein